MNKTRIIFVVLVVIFISVCFGYKVIKTDSEVNNKFASIKDLDVIVYKIGNIEEYESTDATATILQDKKSVIIDVPNLLSKGAYVKIPITIKNVGELPAKLSSIYQNGLSKNSAIKVSYNGIGLMDIVLNPEDERDIEIIIYWDKKDWYEIADIQFLIKFNYIQG